MSSNNQDNSSATRLRIAFTMREIPVFLSNCVSVSFCLGPHNTTSAKMRALLLFLVIHTLLVSVVNSDADPDPQKARAVSNISDRKDGNNNDQHEKDEFKLTNLSKSERRKLDELRKRVKGYARPADRILLADRVLVKWLQARHWNLEAAEQMFRNTLRWRKENKIESILEEDTEKWEKSYPLLIDGFDKHGHLIYIIPAGRYDVRASILAGQGEGLMRYFEKQLEFGVQYGYNVTLEKKTNLDGKGVLILDMNGFNIRQQGCLSCVPFYIRGLTMYEANFPRIVDKLFVVNAPAVVEEVYELIKHAMSEDSRNLISIFGFDKKKWIPALLRQIPADQLPMRYGGTRMVDPKSGKHFGSSRI